MVEKLAKAGIEKYENADISIVGTASVSAQRCAVRFPRYRARPAAARSNPLLARSNSSPARTHSAQVVEIQAIVATFIASVKRTVCKNNPRVPLVFIPECNNNAVYAASILRACKEAAAPNPVMNPFTADNFSAEITPNIGPWTTHANKFAMVEETLVSMLDRRLIVSTKCVTVGHEVINPKIKPTPANDALLVLSKELKRVADDGKTISGKAGGLDDDAAMALFLAVYW